MKKNILTLVVFALILNSCKKEAATESKPVVADITLSINSFKSLNDNNTTYFYSSPLPSITLNNDKTWNLNIEGANSFGTYSWTPTIQYTAQVKFTILQWTHLSSDTTITSKLKNIILNTDKCEFPGTSVYGVTFSGQSYSYFLSTRKQ